MVKTKSAKVIYFVRLSSGGYRKVNHELYDSSNPVSSFIDVITPNICTAAKHTTNRNKNKIKRKRFFFPTQLLIQVQW
jgi:hypothetical protein